MDTASYEDSRQKPAPSAPPRGRVLMEVSGLRKAFGGQVVLEGVDLCLREGEVVLLRGENGSGKTTLLNILTGNLEPDGGEIRLLVDNHPERFRFPRRWWQNLNPWDHFTPERVASEGVGRTWQDTRLFGSQSLLDNLAVAHPGQPGERPWRILTNPRRWKQAETANRRAVHDLLESLGLGDRGDSSASMISLGQTKRVAFARCTRAEAKIIFLDEPLAGLDQGGTESVIAVLRALAARENLTLVIVEHVFNIPIILDFATAVWTLAEGRLTREDAVDASMDPALEAMGHLPAIIARIAGPDVIIRNDSLPRGAVVTRASLPGSGLEPLLTLRNVIARRGQRDVIGIDDHGAATGLDFTIHKGELVFLQAPNGWGKTSLLDVLAGTLPCVQGTVELGGRRLERMRPWERRSLGLAVVPARDDVFESLTVAEYVRIAAGTGPDPGSSAAIDPMHVVNRRLRSRLMSSLSGGERKRLVLENVDAQAATIRVWDEPFTSLDAGALPILYRHLLPGRDGASLVLVPSRQVGAPGT